jgi:hypothetical protein
MEMTITSAYTAKLIRMSLRRARVLQFRARVTTSERMSSGWIIIQNLASCSP